MFQIEVQLKLLAEASLCPHYNYLVIFKTLVFFINWFLNVFSKSLTMGSFLGVFPHYTYSRSLSMYCDVFFLVLDSLFSMSIHPWWLSLLKLNYSVCRGDWICHSVWSCKMLSILPQWGATLLSDCVLWGKTACCQINLLKRNRHDSFFMGEQTNAFVEVLTM